jgi:hypothetical protein
VVVHLGKLPHKLYAGNSARHVKHRFIRRDPTPSVWNCWNLTPPQRAHLAGSAKGGRGSLGLLTDDLCRSRLGFLG